MADLDEVPLDTWDQFVEHVNRLQPPWIFRGQSSARWSLASALERTTRTISFEQAEQYLLREFKRRAHHHLRSEELPRTLGEWLALMQHYGTPTRMLDFTWSPYVAAYFAFEDPPADGASEVAVWAVDKEWCIDASGVVAMEVDPFLRPIAEDALKSLQPQWPQATLGWAAGQIVGGLPGDGGPGREMPGVYPFEPERLSDRMAVQQGILLWCSNLNESFASNFTALGVGNGYRKLVLPTRERERGLRELRRMNITRASLFPGLEGLARSLRHLLVTEPFDQRAKRVFTDYEGIYKRRAERAKNARTP
jgi:FRG domain